MHFTVIWKWHGILSREGYSCLFLQYSFFSKLKLDLWRDILSCIGDFSTLLLLLDFLVVLLDLEHSSHITSLNPFFFTKFVHQICHCNTSLAQMSHFLMTDWYHFFPFLYIYSNGEINDKSINMFGDFVAWQVRHVLVSPIVMTKRWDT